MMYNDLEQIQVKVGMEKTNNKITFLNECVLVIHTREKLESR